MMIHSYQQLSSQTIQQQQIYMYSLIKKRTINEIIASRKSQRQQRQEKLYRTPSNQAHVQYNSEFKMELFLKKTSFNNQDKFILLKYLEKKYRIRFDNSFNPTLMNWIIIKEKKVLDKHYDSTKKSYYMLRGHISVCERVTTGGNFLRQTQTSDNQGKVVRRYEQTSSFDGEKGIGSIFCDQIYHKVLLMCENALILEINHSQNQLELVQKNCLMITEQKQAFVKNFTLFKKLDNINKYYTPFFQVHRYTKGDFIYQIDAEAHYFYLIVEGEVEFQTKIIYENPQKGDDPSISKLVLKNSWENFILITTEILGKSNYFGQEQILAGTTRKQNAKCLSISCLIMSIPLEKFNKLMFYNDFRETLESSSQTKEYQRKKKISNYMTHRNPRQDNTVSQKKIQTINFTQFNQAIYNACTARKQQNKKFSLKNHHTKILHGSALRINSSHHKAKNESFSMLEVNHQMYESSMKKFRAYSVQEKKRRNKAEKTVQGQKQARSLHQIWKVLKLQNIIQDEEKLSIQKGQGKVYFNAHLRLVKHLKDVKSYRPKTISSNCRVKTEYVEYLQQVL